VNHELRYVEVVFVVQFDMLLRDLPGGTEENHCKKAIPLQALTDLEGSRRLRLPDIKTIGTWRWQGCQPYAPAAFTRRKYSWYSFLLEAELAPGP
jgi:hypothetical protein